LVSHGSWKVECWASKSRASASICAMPMNRLTCFVSRIEGVSLWSSMNDGVTYLLHAVYEESQNSCYYMK